MARHQFRNVSEPPHWMNPVAIGQAQSAAVVSWIPNRAESHLSGGDGLVVLEHDLRYDLRTAVVHQLVGL